MQMNTERVNSDLTRLEHAKLRNTNCCLRLYSRGTWIKSSLGKYPEVSSFLIALSYKILKICSTENILNRQIKILSHVYLVCMDNA